MNIILFGAPGIGKSSIIGQLKATGHRAIDLEDMYPNRVRFGLPNMIDDAFIGAADLSPNRKYPHAIKVLLTMRDQDAYEARRAERDSHREDKAQQAAHQLRSWELAEYDYILDTQDRTVEQMAEELLKIGGHYGLHT